MVQGVSATTARRAMDTMPPGYLETPGLYATNAPKGDKVDISTKPKKKRTFIGTLAKLAITAGAVAGGLVLAAKKGWTKPLEEGAKEASKWYQKLSGLAYKWGDKIDQKAWTPLVKFCKTTLEKIKTKNSEANATQL